MEKLRGHDTPVESPEVRGATEQLRALRSLEPVPPGCGNGGPQGRRPGGLRLSGPRSLAGRLALASALLVVATVGVLSVLAVTASRRSLREQVLATNFLAASLVAQAVDAYVADAVATVEEAPGRPKLRREVRTRNWPEARDVLVNFLQHFRKFDYVFLQDPEGIIRARVPDAETVGKSFAFREFFQGAMRTRRPYVSDVYVSTAARRPVVSIAVPFVEDGTVAGVLVGALSIAALDRFVAGIGLQEGTRLYVVDRSGIVVAHSEGQGIEGPVNLAAQPPVLALRAGRTGTMEFRETDGAEPQLAAYVPVSRLGWGVVATRPTALAYAPADRLGQWLLTAAGVCGAVAVGLGIAFARTLTGRLSLIAGASGRLAGGDLGARTGLRPAADEIGQLASSFDAMAASLERRRAEAEGAATEVRRLNAELERRVADRTSRLEALNQELEAFTYTVSHDLKAPLRGMEGYARAVLEDYGGQLDETGRRYLHAIGKAARQMGELIDDLLRYSRLERREMRWQAVALRPLLEGVCAELEPELRARGLALRWQLGVDTVRAEREGLREALANLVGNAVKFSRDGGGTITLASRREGDDVVLSVGDEGIGFDMKYHDRIFRIFERLQRDDEYPGTGVGLAIVRKVAERHGGRTWAESRPGQGSVFHLALPTPADAEATP